MSRILRIDADKVAAPWQTLSRRFNSVLVGILAYLSSALCNFLVFGLFRLRRVSTRRRSFEMSSRSSRFTAPIPPDLFVTLSERKPGRAVHHLSDLRRDSRSCAAGHTRQFLRRNLTAGGPTVSGRRRDHVGAQRHTGVVEEITWRAIKIRTFQNHMVLISNSSAAREPIEVCPRDNLNARLVLLQYAYTLTRRQRRSTSSARQSAKPTTFRRSYSNRPHQKFRRQRRRL